MVGADGQLDGIGDSGHQGGDVSLLQRSVSDLAVPISAPAVYSPIGGEGAAEESPALNINGVREADSEVGHVRWRGR